MRVPEHDYIAVEMNATMADEVDRLLGPDFTLALFPEALQSKDPDDPPTYFIAVSGEGQAAISRLKT